MTSKTLVEYAAFFVGELVRLIDRRSTLTLATLTSDLDRNTAKPFITKTKKQVAIRIHHAF